MTLEKRIEKLEQRSGGEHEQITTQILYRGDNVPRPPNEAEKALVIAQNPGKTMLILQWNGSEYTMFKEAKRE